MVLSKLFNQFTGGAKDSAKLADAMPIPVEMAAPTTSAPDPGVVPEAPKKSFNVIEDGILEEEIIETLRGCFDPEIPVNIYDMGLIYEIKIEKDRFVNVKMTLTSPGCPVAGTLPPDVERRVAGVEGVKGAKVELVWDPTWSMDFMSEDAKLELGFF